MRQVEHDPESKSEFLVVIGASAGGLDTISAIIRELPDDFGAPIVIAMHISPSRVSHLGRILSARTSLPVVTLEQQSALLPGTIYVVPSNRNVQIQDGHVLLTSNNPGSQPSVDLLFRSAAEAYGENLIAVVLTGTGSDGSIGARFVKTHGGTVIVQDPNTAAYPGMPLSLSPSDVDVTVNVDRIPSLLTEFVHGGFVVSDASERSTLRSLLEELREQSGVDFTTYKQATIQRRVQRRMAATGAMSFPEYSRTVRRDREERLRLVKSFLINVTRFFRDEDLFAYLREHVLPELIDDAAQRKADLRIWSAGCSTGEEAYSLAITIHELIEQSESRVHARIFATDLDEDAVNFARQGIFPARALEDVPRDIVDRYFTPLGDEFEVRKQIRGMLVFGQHDLARRAPFPAIDLVVCRNVLIYFTVPLQRHALQLFAFSLRNGGYLVLGKSESSSLLDAHFVPDHTALKVFRRVGSRTHVLQPGKGDATLFASTRTPALKDFEEASPARADTMAVQLTPVPGGIRDEEGVLDGLQCGVVVVNASYDIQYLNSQARQFFGIYSTVVGQDLIHLLQRYDPIAIRRVIDRVAQSGEPASGVLSSNEATGNGPQRLEITCRQMKQGEETHIVLTAIEVTERETMRGRLESAEETSARLMKANEEVLATNLYLARTIQLLRDELEDLLVTSTEVQAATEEVETLNEELQASNEELETLNEELQATIEELNATNDDLEARSLEVQAIALRAETARHQLHAILDAVDDGVIVVESNGVVLLHSQVLSSSLGEALEMADFLDSDRMPMAPDQTPIARAAAGETFSMLFTIAGSPGPVYEAIGRPVAIPDGRRLGVVTVRPSVESEVSTDR